MSTKIVENKETLLKQKINFFSFKYFNILAVAIALVVFIAGFFLLVAPKYKKIMAVVKAASEQSEIEYQSRVDYLAEINQLRLNFNQISSSDINKVDDLLPDYSGSDEILFAKLESMASKSGLLLKSIQISASDQKDSANQQTAPDDKAAAKAAQAGIKKTDITMSFVGATYDNLKYLLNLMENNLPLFDINEISFSESDLILDFSAYYFE